VYFTEQMVIPHRGDTNLGIADPTAKVVIGATQNWSRNVLLWNLAADQKNGPHTSNGGCPICSGAITIDGDKVTRNLAYYVTAQLTPFVTPGSVRIASAGADSLPHVAFLTPRHKHVLLVSNTTGSAATFTVNYNHKQASVPLAAGAVGTYVW
jgi:glucosylceramidase